jgi:hypothetical protein
MGVIPPNKYADRDTFMLHDDSVIISPEKIIGRGGSGIVHAAQLISPDGRAEPAAAKSLAVARWADDRDRRKFEREFSIALRATQQCRGSCVIHGQLVRNGVHYIIMKRYQRNLHEELEQRRTDGGGGGGGAPGVSILDAVHFD